MAPNVLSALLLAAALLVGEAKVSAVVKKTAVMVVRPQPAPEGEAQRCEEGGSEDGGIGACREALRLGLREPRRTALRQLLVRRLAEQERFDELVLVYLEDTQEHPTDGEAWRRLGAARLFLRADPAGALPALEEAVKLRNEDPLAHVLRGLCLSGLSRHEEAVVAIEEALRLDPAALELRPAARAVYEAARRGEPWP